MSNNSITVYPKQTNKYPSTHRVAWIDNHGLEFSGTKDAARKYYSNFYLSKSIKISDMEEKVIDHDPTYLVGIVAELYCNGIDVEIH